MIKCMDMYTPTGWVARYGVSDSAGRTRPESRDVESFSDDGDALVVDRARGRLVPAAQVHGFIDLQQCNRLPVTVVPSLPGWRVAGKTTEGTEWEEHVLAWFVTDVGSGYPMIPQRDEGVIEVLSEDEFELRGPDEPPSASVSAFPVERARVISE